MQKAKLNTGTCKNELFLKGRLSITIHSTVWSSSGKYSTFGEKRVTFLNLSHTMTTSFLSTVYREFFRVG